MPEYHHVDSMPNVFQLYPIIFPLYSHYIQRSSHSIPIKSVNRQHMIAFFHICPWFLEKPHHPVVAYSNSPIWISSATMERHRKQPWRKRSWKGRANKKWWIYRIAGWWFVFLTFPYIGNVIIPTDELIFFRSWNHQPDCLFLWKYGISPKMGCKMGKIHLYHLTWWGPPVEKVLNSVDSVVYGRYNELVFMGSISIISQLWFIIYNHITTSK